MTTLVKRGTARRLGLRTSAPSVVIGQTNRLGPRARLVQPDYYSPDPLRRYAAELNGVLIFDTPTERATAEGWAKTQDRPGYPTRLNMGQAEGYGLAEQRGDRP